MELDENKKDVSVYNHWNGFPDEIWLSILLLVDDEHDLLCLSECCKSLYIIHHEYKIWNRIYLHHFSWRGPIPEDEEQPKFYFYREIKLSICVRLDMVTTPFHANHPIWERILDDVIDPTLAEQWAWDPENDFETEWVSDYDTETECEEKAHVPKSRRRKRLRLE
jgi:hypothetical protein